MYHDGKTAQVTSSGTGRSWKTRRTFRVAGCFLLLIGAHLAAGNVYAFRVLDVSELGFGIGRWNADPHFVDGVERSLDGGLRYSLQGASYAAYLDQFQWEGTAPSVAEFQAAVEQSFAAWEAVDPASGLGTDLYFVPDFDTPVFLEPYETAEDRFVLNRGAEIDLFAGPTPGLGGFADVFGDPVATTVALTSGVSNYPAGVFSGFDISMSNNHVWPTLDVFKRVLTHEIGHAIGLRDVDVHPVGLPRFSSLFYDDNFDANSHADALATLTNSFAHLIDPFDPDNSPALMLYEPCDEVESCPSSPGFDTVGVNILMETSPQFNPGVPQNDDFAGRQFLYPYVAVAGDFNDDGAVDAADAAILFGNWGSVPPGDPIADINGDYVVDAADASALFGAWTGDDSAAVPEPGTGAVALLGIIGLSLCRRRGVS